ncbi:polynucleotide kinase [Dysgonomonas sp. 216]|uniref:phosphatase domain-containing protein n=1 Tax=Dysgonomonas sp. 216 TaxID=2302934 RepID=UPI0013D7902A|nr:polynucleotide kinase [Dysgonomonas sp. 216]NDW18018.1 polynucleotide kinase [Dysgonomonas sp. 216]
MENEQLDVLVLLGVSDDEKVLFARKLVESGKNWMFVNRNGIRQINFSEIKMGVRQENLITEMILSSVNGLLSKKSNVVLDIDTFKEDHYTQLITRFNHQASISFKVFEAHISDKTDKAQTKRIKEFDNFLEKFDVSQRKQIEDTEKVLEQDETLPKAIICDLDGTLALMNGRPSYNASKADEDILNVSVANLLKIYSGLGYKILLLTGRYERFREPSLRFLSIHNVLYDGLWMRKDGDMRKDAVTKYEVFMTEIYNKYFVEFVLEDRNQVVDMWRKEIGLPCFQVNYGDF